MKETTMRLEATGTPIKYRLLTGKEVILRQGFPVDMPEASAWALMICQW